MIHFTREDNYLDNPLWQSDMLLRDNVDVIPIWHNDKFTVVKMIARYNGGGAPKIERIVRGISFFFFFPPFSFLSAVMGEGESSLLLLDGVSRSSHQSEAFPPINNEIM